MKLLGKRQHNCYVFKFAGFVDDYRQLEEVRDDSGVFYKSGYKYKETDFQKRRFYSDDIKEEEEEEIECLDLDLVIKDCSELM